MKKRLILLSFLSLPDTPPATLYLSLMLFSKLCFHVFDCVDFYPARSQALSWLVLKDPHFWVLRPRLPVSLCLKIEKHTHRANKITREIKKNVRMIKKHYMLKLADTSKVIFKGKFTNSNTIRKGWHYYNTQLKKLEKTKNKKNPKPKQNKLKESRRE